MAPSDVSICVAVRRWRLATSKQRLTLKYRYTEKQMNDIKIAHREASSWSDWIALSIVRIMRTGMDIATGYRHSHEVAVGQSEANDAKPAGRFQMSERKWLVRFVFLESVAGVPGMVAGMLRHLRSLRKMQRDNGW